MDEARKAPGKPFYRRGWFIAVAVVGILVTIGTLVGKPKPTETAAPTNAPPAIVTTSSTAVPTVITPIVTTQPVPTTAAELIMVPDLVGQDLQAAQDAMQAVGLFGLTSHDATGQNRFQVLDRDWQVCDQTPPGGAQGPSSATVDFGAVKDSEQCPGTEGPAPDYVALVVLTFGALTFRIPAARGNQGQVYTVPADDRTTAALADVGC